MSSSPSAAGWACRRANVSRLPAHDDPEPAFARTALLSEPGWPGLEWVGFDPANNSISAGDKPAGWRSCSTIRDAALGQRPAVASATQDERRGLSQAVE